MPLKGKSFFAHQGKERLAVLQDFLTAVRPKRWRVGATVFLPRYSAPTATSNLQTLDATSLYVLGDPETRRMVTEYAKRGRGRETHPFLAVNHTVAKQAFVDAVLDAQLASNRSILLSPALIHGRAPNQRDLDLTIEYARLAASSARVNGRKLFLAVEATDEVFADATARGDMLDKLVELPEHPIYLRMTCAGQPTRDGYTNARGLSGLRAAVESLSNNDRPVFVAQSGLVGWMMLSFGAFAFGSGISSSLQRCTGPGGGGGGGGNLPLKWYFASSVLGFVLADDLPVLRSVPGWDECDCPFCAAFPPTTRAFNADAAGQHYLWWCAKLANEANGRNALAATRARIQAAQQFWRAAQPSLAQIDPRSRPSHLAAWSAAVA